MSVEFECAVCSARLRVGDAARGKRIRCPRCGTIAASTPEPAESAGGSQQEWKLGASGMEQSSVAPAASTHATSTSARTATETLDDDRWSMKTSEGKVFGPVVKETLDSWVREGRLDVHCLVIREGTDRWQWASDVYPQLRPSPGPDPAGHQSQPGRHRIRLATPVAQPVNSRLAGPQQARPRFGAPAAARPSSRNRIAAGSLGILLGAFGVHRFYLGFPLVGLLQLALTIITYGFGAVWGIVEGVVILGGGFDYDGDGALLD